MDFNQGFTGWHLTFKQTGIINGYILHEESTSYTPETTTHKY